MMLRRTIAVMGVLLAIAWAQPAAAYIGPGAGLAVIGAAAALLGAVILGIFGFVWYPVKRLIAGLRRTGRGAADTPGE
jgi:hypothetical protein